jgi:hypothetical protein
VPYPPSLANLWEESNLMIIDLCLSDLRSTNILQKARSEMALLFFMISPTNMQFFHLLKHKDTDQLINRLGEPGTPAI